MVIPQEYLTTVFLLPGGFTAFPESFAVITAWNPMDRPTTRKENELADESLRRSLELRQLPYLRVTGCSPDLSHREPGWGVRIKKEEAIRLGKRFDQRAIWWVTGDDLVVIHCEDGSEEPAGSFRSRIRPMP